MNSRIVEIVAAQFPFQLFIKLQKHTGFLY